MDNATFSEFDKTFLETLAQRVDANRADLTSRCQRALRETSFTNRAAARPDELARIAAEEADVLIDSLRNSLSSAAEHGAALCERGLGIAIQKSSFQKDEGFYGTLWEK